MERTWTREKNAAVMSCYERRSRYHDMSLATQSFIPHKLSPVAYGIRSLDFMQNTVLHWGCFESEEANERLEKEDRLKIERIKWPVIYLV